MQGKSGIVLVLGTGGTIAGTGAGPHSSRYVAAQLPVERLLAAVPSLQSERLEAQQVEQVDSKDMDWPVWQALGEALQAALARQDVDGVVITHGTDTLEETAYLLHRLVDGDKPVVLTAAMRPATSAEADGPRNLRDAVRVARWAAEYGRAGVVAVMQGVVWAGSEIRKAHSWHIDAFDAGGKPAVATVGEDGQVRPCGAWPVAGRGGLRWLGTSEPPRVEVVLSHAGADGWAVDALLSHGVIAQEQTLKGLVVACTGHGTLHHGLEAALERAQAQGVTVWRSTRVARGGVASRQDDRWPAAGDLTPAQARVGLVLKLLGVPPEG